MIVLCRLLRQAKIESRPEMPHTDSPFSAVPPDELAEHVHHIVFLVVPFLQKSLGMPAVFLLRLFKSGRFVRGAIHESFSRY